MNSFEKHIGNNHVEIQLSESHKFGEIDFKKHIGKPLSEELYDDLVHKLHVSKIRVYKPGEVQWTDGGNNRCFIDLDKDDNIENVVFEPDFSAHMAKWKLSKYKEILLIIEGLCLAEAHDTIYKVAHSFLGHCKNPHEDWKKEIQEIKKKLKEDKIIDVDKILAE